LTKQSHFIAAPFTIRLLLQLCPTEFSHRGDGPLMPHP
jgi:hypothetical protein